MKKLFNFSHVDYDKLYIDLLLENNIEFDLLVIDENTNITVFNTKIIGGQYQLWVSLTPFIHYLHNIKLVISSSDSYQEEKITLSGQNRFVVVNDKKIKPFNSIESNSFFTIQEIFYEKIYDKDFVKLSVNDVVVDIGANVGFFSLYSQNYLPSKIYCLEPFEDNFIHLQNNLSPYNNTTFIKKAISNNTGTSTFSISTNNSVHRLSSHDEFSSLINPVVDSTIVETISFNDLLKDYDIKKIDFLKIDCEGGEIDIFETIDLEYLRNNIKKIALEYHSIDIRDRIAKILTSNSFIIENSDYVNNQMSYGMIYAYNKNLFNIQ
jgi:FkbM family methyltransferase